MVSHPACAVHVVVAVNGELHAAWNVEASTSHCLWFPGPAAPRPPLSAARRQRAWRSILQDVTHRTGRPLAEPECGSRPARRARTPAESRGRVRACSQRGAGPCANVANVANDRKSADERQPRHKRQARGRTWAVQGAAACPPSRRPPAATARSVRGRDLRRPAPARTRAAAYALTVAAASRRECNPHRQIRRRAKRFL